MSIRIQVTPTNILSAMSGTTTDFISASLVAGTIDWMFHFIPMGEGTVLSSLLSVLQLSLAASFTIALKGYLGLTNNTTMFLPIFIWSWSPNATMHLQKSYRVFERTFLGINNNQNQ